MARLLVAANSSWNLQHFRIGLLRDMVRRGHRVTTLSPDLDGIEIDGCPLPHRRCAMDRSGTNPFGDLRLLVDLARVIREERPEAYLSFTIKPNIYGSWVCRLLGIPAVPNVSGLGTAFLTGPRFRLMVVKMYRIAFASAKHVMFQNPDDRDFFISEQIVRKEHARLVPGSGINLEDFPIAELPPRMRFLMVGRLLGDKGVREYAEAAAKLRGELPDTTFALLGELDKFNRSAIAQSELDQWIRVGAVEYLGSTGDVRPFIAASSAIVLPSYREGLPRTLLEGAAMGRPLIGTDVPGCRELVRDGVTGFLCKPGDADSLASAMARLVATSSFERNRMGKEARAMVELEFDERLVFATYADALDDLVSPPRV